MRFFSGLFSARPSQPRPPQRDVAAADFRRRWVTVRFGQVCRVIGELATYWCWACERRYDQPSTFFGSHDLCEMFLDIGRDVFAQQVRRAEVIAHVAAGNSVSDCQHDMHVIPRFAGERAHTESVGCHCGPHRDHHNNHVVVHRRYPEA